MNCNEKKMHLSIFTELLPRIYLETCFLKCYRFIIPEGSNGNDNDSGNRSVIEAVSRLSNAIRGVSDPIVASYARAFLVRMAHQGSKVLSLN